MLACLLAIVCLALGQHLGRPVIMADRVWASLDVGVEVVVIW
jgi:PIN domain nuclease of toxin-antitoxin system